MTEAPWDECDDEDAPPDPWEIGDDQCTCELYLRNCDAREPWCTFHEEWRESVAYYEQQRLRNIERAARERQAGDEARGGA